MNTPSNVGSGKTVREERFQRKRRVISYDFLVQQLRHQLYFIMNKLLGRMEMCYYSEQA